MSYDRLPDQITGPMTTSQANTLRSLAVEAYQEKLFQPDLSRSRTRIGRSIPNDDYYLTMPPQFAMPT
jgi:hypothetical protein